MFTIHPKAVEYLSKKSCAVVVRLDLEPATGG